jgi:soluble lytic murein transglycosylase-like protein
MKKFYIVAFALLCVAFLCGIKCGQARLDKTVDTQTEPIAAPQTEAVTSEPITDDAPQTEESPQTEEPVEEVMYYDCPLSHDLQDFIRVLCNKKGISMSLVLAVIEVESAFCEDVISQSDDYGLMQINVINHEWLYEKYGITDFLDPYNNILCGITILSMHYENYGDETKALMAYNLGATGAKRKWDNGIFETPYSKKVQSVKARYDLEVK